MEIYASSSHISPTHTIEFEKAVKAQLHKMNECKCNQCKMYKKHMKSVELLKRFQLREFQIQKEIDIQRDIFWNYLLQKLLAHRKAAKVLPEVRKSIFSFC